MEKRILLDFNEKAYNELIKNQEAVEKPISAFIGYCEETLEIKVSDLKALMANPKEYCLNAYWEKYGSQFGNAPVKKEKAFELTGWNDAEADSYFKEAKTALSRIPVKYFNIEGSEIKFTSDAEEFKKYLEEKDQELYDLTLEFIEVAKKMEATGGKPAWYLARYYPTLTVEGNDVLVPSKDFFTSSEKIRNTPLSHFMA